MKLTIEDLYRVAHLTSNDFNRLAEREKATPQLQNLVESEISSKTYTRLFSLLIEIWTTLRHEICN